MATFKFSGEMRYANDTQLWKEILNKERYTHEMLRQYQLSDHFANTHKERFGDGKFEGVKSNKEVLRNTMNDKLAQTQQLGFYKTDYLKDQVNHFSDPAYSTIKPAYRPSMPFPNNDQLEVKHLYSFHPWGDPKNPRGGKDMFRSTFRQTLQKDTPYFRDKLSAYNVKHALVDPSHTFTMLPHHSTRKDIDMLAYDPKLGKDKNSRELQSIRRTTYDIHGKVVLRLPENRDYWGEKDPVEDYFATKDANKQFFRMKSADKIDFTKFNRDNYLVAPTSSVGVAKFKSYLREKSNPNLTSDSRASSRGVGYTKNRHSRNQSEQIERFKILKEMLKNEKKVNEKLNEILAEKNIEAKNLSYKIKTGRA